MPTVFVGGPLALICLLFPTVCACLILYLRRWGPLLTVVSLCSTVCLLRRWFYTQLFDSWVESECVMWMFLMTIALFGLIRQRRVELVSFGIAGPASRNELLVICLMIAACISGMIFWSSALEVYGHFVTVLTIGLTSGLVYSLLWIPSSKITNAPHMWSSQSVILVAITIGSLLFLSKAGMWAYLVGEVKMKWCFVSKERGSIYSSPAIAANEVFVGAVIQTQDSLSGALYCVDRNHGELLWTFNDRGKMKPVASSPCYANGRVYVGEGFHTDMSCKLYCIDSVTGKSSWEFKTNGHTEAQPCVVGGRVYFSAGDDGLYCLDADNGGLKWHFEGPHVDMCPAVVNDRIYAGSGYSASEVFCLDAINGVPIWRVSIDGNAFGSTAVLRGSVVIGVGYGNVPDSKVGLSGALVCFDAQSGAVKWRYITRGPVNSKPALFGNSIIFASLDNYCYCVRIENGELQWQHDAKAPVVAAPVAAPNAIGEECVYVLNSAGTLYCLNTTTGSPYSITSTAEFAPVNSDIGSTPAIVFNRSKLFDRAQIIYGGGVRELTTRPILFCFQ